MTFNLLSLLRVRELVARLAGVLGLISPTELVAYVNSVYAATDQQITAMSGTRPNRLYVTKRYATLFTGITAGTTQTNQIQISANGDFFLCRMKYAANISNAAQTSSTLVVPELRLQVTDSGSDELFGNQALDINSFASLSAFPNKDVDEVYPRIVSGRSTLTIAITNAEASNTYNVEFILEGVLVKTWGGNV